MHPREKVKNLIIYHHIRGEPIPPDTLALAERWGVSVSETIKMHDEASKKRE